jgi:beta-lactamase regulating signal transducer with metallopeptidase domain
MITAILPQMIPTAVEHTLDSLVGGLVLCAVAWTWLRVATRQNSASRFLILFILLIGVAALPFAGISWTGHTAVASASLDTHALITLPEHFAEYLFLTWAVIAFVLLSRVGVGLVQLLRLKRNCFPVDTAELDPQVQAALATCKRQVELCTSERVNVPTALGFSSPAKIAIPTWLVDQLSPEELHHVVLHEAAHLRRWDDWTNLAQRVLGAVLFFHPAVWWLEARLSLEREMACDECVLAETQNARAYAKSLANIAERSFVHRTVALAQAAVSRLHDTSLRVAHILSPSPRRTASKLTLLASVAAASAATVGVAAYSPNLVGFSEPKAPVIARADFPTPALAKTVVLPMVEAAPALASRKPISKPLTKSPVVETFDTPTMAHAQQPALYVPAKITDPHHRVTQQPNAMLVVWQETYTDGYVTIRQSFWQIVVLHPPTTKEQPVKIT